MAMPTTIVQNEQSVQEISGVYDSFLSLTEEIESVVVAEDYDKLAELLEKRSEIFDNFLQQPLQATEQFLQKILACEERCLKLAAEKKEVLQKELHGVRSQQRLEKAYGQHGG